MDAVNLINCHIFVCSECCGETAQDSHLLV